jgi:hypothetical protein
MWSVLELTLCSANLSYYCLVGQLTCYCSSLLYSSSQLMASNDHHDSEVHDSLVNSSVQAFEFNLNLSLINIATYLCGIYS